MNVCSAWRRRTPAGSWITSGPSRRTPAFRWANSSADADLRPGDEEPRAGCERDGDLLRQAARGRRGREAGDAGMNQAMRKAAKGGVTDLRGHIDGAIVSIRDAETDTEALTIATATFGAGGRAAHDLPPSGPGSCRRSSELEQPVREHRGPDGGRIRSDGEPGRPAGDGEGPGARGGRTVWRRGGRARGRGDRGRARRSADRANGRRHRNEAPAAARQPGRVDRIARARRYRSQEVL